MGMYRLFLGGILVAFPAFAVAGVHPPEVETRLSFIVNDWTIKGKEDVYRETCEWYAQQSFVVCNSVGQEKGPATYSVGIVGWSAATRNYTYYHYGQNGGSRLEQCFENELSGLTCLHEERDGGDLIQNRTIIWPVASGIAFTHEYSRNGGPWKETVRNSYVPRKG